MILDHFKEKKTLTTLSFVIQEYILACLIHYEEHNLFKKDIHVKKEKNIQEWHIWIMWSFHDRMPQTAVQLLLHWLHACLDSFLILLNAGKYIIKINLWHSKNQIFNQIRIWMWLIRWKGWFSISVARTWEVAAAWESLEVLHLLLVSKTSRAKSSRGRNCAPIILSRHLLNTQLCVCRAAQHSGLCTRCTARVQPAGTEHSAAEQLWALPEHSVSLLVLPLLLS